MLVSSSSLVFSCAYQPATIWLINVIAGLWFALSSGCARFYSNEFPCYLSLFPIICSIEPLFIVAYVCCQGTVLCWTGHVWEDYWFHQVFPNLCWFLFFLYFLELYLYWTLIQFLLYVLFYFFACPVEMDLIDLIRNHRLWYTTTVIPSSTMISYIIWIIGQFKVASC